MKAELKEYGFVILPMLFSFFSPAIGIICALVFASIVDHFFGVWKARFQKEKVSFWIGFWSTFTKSMMYAAIIMSAFSIDRVAINDLITLIAGKPDIDWIFTKIVALMLFAIELFSINRSYKTVKGVSIFSALMNILKKGREVANEVGKIKSEIKSEG